MLIKIQQSSLKEKLSGVIQENEKLAGELKQYLEQEVSSIQQTSIYDYDHISQLKEQIHILEQVLLSRCLNCVIQMAQESGTYEICTSGTGQGPGAVGGSTWAYPTA